MMMVLKYDDGAKSAANDIEWKLLYAAKKIAEPLVETCEWAAVNDIQPLVLEYGMKSSSTYRIFPFSETVIESTGGTSSLMDEPTVSPFLTDDNPTINL